MVSLSVVIIAKNEEKNIKDCIASVQFADEIIVIDDLSTDATIKIAENMGAIVYRRAMNGDYAAQYNFALAKATSDWILIVDADERVTPELKKEILAVIANNTHCGYKVSFLNFAMDQPLYHGGWFSHSGLRLFPRDTVRYEGMVHSNMVHELPLLKLENHFLHYSYANWERYFAKFNVYTKLAAKENYKKGKKAHFFSDIILRPFYAFFKMYILRGGWLDGKMGFIMAAYHLFYTMTKYVRLYYMEKGGDLDT